MSGATEAPEVVAGAIAARITSFLAANPAFGDMLVSACTSGLNQAVERANNRAGNYSVAMLCALSLQDSKRMSKEMREHFYKLIAQKIDAPGLSEIERRFVDMGRQYERGEA